MSEKVCYQSSFWKIATYINYFSKSWRYDVKIFAVFSFKHTQNTSSGENLIHSRSTLTFREINLFLFKPNLLSVCFWRLLTSRRTNFWISLYKIDSEDWYIVAKAVSNEPERYKNNHSIKVLEMFPGSLGSISNWKDCVKVNEAVNTWRWEQAESRQYGKHQRML